MKKALTILLFFGLIFGLYFGFKAYNMIYAPNVLIEKDSYIYLENNSYENLIQQLNKQQIINDISSFETVAERKKNFKSRIKPGKYLIKKGMSNNQIINLLRSGDETFVKITFQHVRTPEDLAGYLAKNIGLDSTDIYHSFYNEQTIKKYGFNKNTIITLFLPDTYFVSWAITSEELIERMAKEYRKFWTKERIRKAEKIQLSQSEVSTLASIVQAEQSIRVDERPTIAGLYINRLKKGMLLQSDPTVIYAVKDFTIKRVLHKHLEFDSPYNTYKYAGLPPGPILIPSKHAINAVLNYKKHDYIFMCAKEDFSGYSNFSKTLSQHNVYAKRYQQALNKKKVYR